MPCSGCDARRQWLKRKAKLMAQTVAALVRQEPKVETEQALATMAKDIAALPLSITEDTDRGSK